MFNFSVYNTYYPIIFQQQPPPLLSLDLQHLHHQYSNRRRRNQVIHNNNPKQTEAQRASLKQGLQKSLDASNKGFEILTKMGYEAGKPLGKDGSGITEPLTIPIKDNPHGRAGLGKESKVKKPKTPSETGAKVTTSSCKDVKAPVAVVTKQKELLQIRKQYHDDIELLRLRLKAELSVKANCDDTMIIVQVAITGETICPQIFEVIHQYLVNSLHVYKATPFPMFHDIAHVEGEIKVVCEDELSFKYLSDCVQALSTNLSMPMTAKQVPLIGENVYWFEVQVPGMLGGPQSFLMQIRKHRFEVKSDRWIVTVQEPDAKKNQTKLDVITDEHSAMLLIYRYSLKLFVCMQEMEFSLKGIIPFEE